MIGDILEQIAIELNYFICTRQGISPENQRVYLSYIVNQDGSVASQEENVMLVTLVDIAKDGVAYSVQAPYSGANGAGYGVAHNSVHVNLMVLFAAYFQGNRAKDAMNYLSYVFEFFQAKPVFTKQNCPGLPANVEKIEFSIETLGFNAQNHLWGILGAKYMPSVVYKMRMLSYLEENYEEFFPPVSTTDTQVS